MQDPKEIIRVVGAQEEELNMIFIFDLVGLDDKEGSFRMTLRHWHQKEIRDIANTYQRLMMYAFLPYSRTSLTFTAASYGRMLIGTEMRMGGTPSSARITTTRGLFQDTAMIVTSIARSARSCYV